MNEVSIESLTKFHWVIYWKLYWQVYHWTANSERLSMKCLIPHV